MYLINNTKFLLSHVIESVFIGYLAIFDKDFYAITKISSHLTVFERNKLFDLAKKAKTIAEIGSYTGASACCFGEASIGKISCKIICIDTWNNDAMSEGNRDTWIEFQNNTHKYENLIIPIRGFSTDVVEYVRTLTDKLDILFIDGDHSYEGVKADWDSYKNFLKPGSIVIFHDYGWADGVKRVVHEDVMPIVESYKQLPNMWWGKIGKSL